MTPGKLLGLMVDTETDKHMYFESLMHIGVTAMAAHEMTTTCTPRQDPIVLPLTKSNQMFVVII